MLAESADLIGDSIPFYFEPNNVDIIKANDNDHVSMKFVSTQNDAYHHEFYIDFMITNLDRIDDKSTYNKMYEPTCKSKAPHFMVPSDAQFHSPLSQDISSNAKERSATLLSP